MRVKKNCQNCFYYTKLTDLLICSHDDGFIKFSPSKYCKYWKGIKYNRLKSKQNFKFDLEQSF